MFEYWERGERKVTVPAYQDAFCVVYGAPPQALGFTRTEEELAPSAPLPLAISLVDPGTVRLLDDQTHRLRLLDRRLGSPRHAVLVDAHCALVEEQFHHCIGPIRPALAAVLVEAATFAGWLALDRVDCPSSWSHHETARSAALEAHSVPLLAHAIAQQSFVLADSGEVLKAVDAAAEARRLISTKGPAQLRAWVSMTEAEALAAAGDGIPARSRIAAAERLLQGAPDQGPRYLMLNEQHLARWVGHCLTTLGDPAAIAELERALPGQCDSVRAAASLHADLALAYDRAGDRDRSAAEATHAADLARRCQSKRLLRRLQAEPRDGR